MTVYEAIETRKSIREYEKRPVDREALTRVLEAGRLAPTARCSNATRFVVVDDPELLKKVQAACMGQPVMGKAPMALIVCSDSTRVMGCDQRASTIDCSIALSFMMLAAAAEGLGTCWIGGFEQPPLKEALGIPEEETLEDTYADSDSISDWAKNAVAWAVEEGYMNGKGENNLDPQGTATRAQCAAMLMRFVEM